MFKKHFRESISRSLLVAAVIGAAFAAALAQQAAGSGSVSGMVLRGGSPALGIPVTATSATAGITLKATTDKTGNFTFPRVPAGPVTVAALDPDGKVLGSNTGVVQGTNDTVSVTVVIH